MFKKSAAPAAAGGGYTIAKSLRFRSSASAYLNRTPGVAATNNQKFTWSGWVKRGKLSTSFLTLFSAYISNTESGYFEFRFNSSDQLQFTTWTLTGNTTAVFRDTAAWYHIVVAADTTQATAANRLIVYVNNQSYPIGSNLTQNLSLAVNANGTIQYIGNLGAGDDQFDGYMAEVNMVDGQALTPSSFGSYNSTTGVWQPIAYTGTYGTNGFYLKFTDTSSTAALGTDYSGNSNTWTVNNISLTAGYTYDSMTDVPTLTSASVANYIVMNPLNTYHSITPSNGNLTLSGTGVGGYGTIAVNSGKYYFEVTFSTIGSGTPTIGIRDSNNGGNYALYWSDGQKNINGTITSYGSSWTANDVIGVAFDITGGTITFYKNNTSQGAISYSYSNLYFTAFIGQATTQGSDVCNINFGQQGFKYTPPTGYVALNTYNLPTSTIVAGNQYMDATLYTGTGSAQSITNAGAFKPDFVWLKSRSGAYAHVVFDSIHGPTVGNEVDAASAPVTSSAGQDFTAFNSNGFSVGTPTNWNSTNYSASTIVAWQWQAGAGSTSSNTNGTLTSTTSVNATAGFSIVTYTGNGSSGATVGHGLGAVPQFIIVKNYTAASSNNWKTYSIAGGNTGTLDLNLANAFSTDSTIWNNTTPTSSVFTLGNSTGVNGNANTYTAFCWTPIAGFSAFGKYTGNGSSDGPFTYTGFRPKFLMIKDLTTGTTDWFILDTSRDTYNICTALLRPDTTQAEQSYSVVDILSNGFKQRNTYGLQNASGDNYFYAAFAENPFKNALAR
jgi:SPRY domain